jgi:hypothetical protein
VSFPRFPQPAVDNRTGIRPPEPRAGGHAFHAQQARRALGISLDGPLAQLRTPFFHFLIGALVAGMAVLARPQRVGVPLGAGLDFVLAVLGVVAVFTYDRLFCPPEAKPGLEGGALPTAALLGEAIALAGTSDAQLWVPAVVVAALVIAAAPHLSAMRALGRDGAPLRLAGDAAGVAVMIPVVIAAVSPANGVVRGLVLACGSFLTVVDAVHTERATRLRVLLAAFGVALATSLSIIPATAGGAVPGAGAILLVLWYGLRGIAVAGGTAKLSRGVLAEYGAFVAVAAALLSTTARH